MGDTDKSRPALEAALPLARRDLERVEKLLRPSLEHFFGSLDTCWVVAPEPDVPVIRRHLADARFRVISETELIPELRLIDPKWVRGWFVQQLVKLSAARIVSSPFYLTLDADVVCVRSIEVADLVQDGRGIANVSDTGRDVHREWYEWSEEVLGFPGSGCSHGVTPAVLSAEGVQRMLEFFEDRLRPNALRAEAYLLGHQPWTEYALYYTFLERMGWFAAYHFPARDRTYQNNVWKGQDAAVWDPARSFASNRGFYFSVLQSNTVHAVDPIVARIRLYYRSIGQPSPF